MELETDRKRKKDKQRQNDENRAEIRPKRARTRSRSPSERREKESRRKRRLSKSKSPDVPVKQERRRDDAPKELEVKKEAPVRKNKETDMLNTRTGGAYIPPARLRMMQAQITDKSSVAYQRLAWEALKKSIHGHINKINVGNIGIIIKELLKENIVRGRGLLCRSVIQAQAASPTFTNVYAALVAAVNSRFPNIGELLLKRLVIQFKRGFKRNDKPICISAASFIAHLVNQRVAHEILALELLTLLVETPTDDSVEVSIAFLKECGQKLTEVSSKGVNAIFEMLRNILHEGQLDKRVQYMIEVMFQVWKDGFKDHPALIEELELVQEEEQFTHLLMLDDATDPQDILNVFKHDDKYEENEQKYKTLSREILGSDAESGEEDGSGSESGSDESDDEEEEGEKAGPVTIIDNTETNLVALRRTIYLTINSSLDFEECAHKLMKMQLKPGQEIELCHMFLDCCAEQRTYEKFYGLLAQRFCNINRIYIGPFEEIFKDSYATAHRLDTNRLRNVSKFFAHLLFTDSISWEVLECVRLNEEDTTSSSRIYIKILFQELAEYMGLKKLNDRLKDQTLQGAFSGIFPRDNPKNTRFSINFFTSIGLGGLTDELREHLKQMPKNVPPAITEINVGSDSSSSGSSSSSSSSDDSSESSSDSEDDEEEGNKNKKDNKSKSKKDKNSKKNKSKSPEPAKEKSVERWGHDGFYDTYGTDARRTESGTQIQQRDKDNFVMPRNRRDRNDRQPERDNYRDEREGNKRSNHSEENYTDRTRRDRNEEDSRRLLNEILGPKKTRDDSRSDSDDRKNSDRRRHERDDGDSRRQEESRNGSDDARDSDKRRRDRYDDDDSRKTRNLERHSSRNIRREELNRGSRDCRRDREEVDTRKESRDERRDKEERDSRNSTRGRDFERDDGDSRRERESRNGSDGDRDSDKRRRDRYDDDDFRKTRDSERDSSKNTRREEPNRGRRDREEVDTRKESRDERSDKEERDSRYSTRDRNFEKEKRDGEQEVTRKKNDYDRDTEIRKNRHEEGISSRDSEKKRNKEDSNDEHTDKRRRKQDIKKEYEREERDSISESECEEQETEERTRRSKKKKSKSKKSKDSDSDGGEKKRSKKSKKKSKSP